MRTRPVSWISWRGRTAAALLLLNALLLFFPPIPPYVKGSLWSYVLKAVIVALAAWEVYREADVIAARWASLSAFGRWVLGLGTAAVPTGIALGMRGLAPDLFERFSAEVGPWETISTACFACGALFLWRLSRACAPPWRGHLRAIATCFGLLFLEETDYGGVFGAFIGRIDGVYVGSLHDMLNLSVSTRWDAAAVIVVVTAGLTGTWLLLRTGWVRPRLILRTLRSAGAVWLLLGALLFGVAALGEVGLAGAAFTQHASPEETVEMAGAICLAVFALEVAAGARRRDVRHTPTAPAEEAIYEASGGPPARRG